MSKKNLPEKICIVCGRPFAWRKKWAKVWDQVKYCSERCRNRKNNSSTQKTGTDKAVRVDIF